MSCLRGFICESEKTRQAAAIVFVTVTADRALAAFGLATTAWRPGKRPCHIFDVV
jgi:hypothetical protein